MKTIHLCLITLFLLLWTWLAVRLNRYEVVISQSTGWGVRLDRWDGTMISVRSSDLP